MIPARKALLRYMEGESELRWCAGWLLDLHVALLGDPAYEWLVLQAGGWFTSDDVFITGNLTELKRLKKEYG